MRAAALANLSPVGSSFPRKEPTVESIVRFGDSVFRNSSAAKLLVPSISVSISFSLDGG